MYLYKLHRTGKIGFCAYPAKVGVKESADCPCGGPQTVKHVLPSCPGFDNQREEMWVSGRVTDLTKLLGEPPLAAKATKFLLSRGEFLPFKLATAPEGDNNVADDLSDEGISFAGAELSN